jgi:hypothetical protein
MVTMRALVVIVAAASGCVDTSLSSPFRAEVLVRTPAGDYVLQTVDLPELTGFDPMSDPVTRFSDHPNFDEDELVDYDASSFAAPSDYSPRVRDVGGVAVARDLESLLTMSAYYSFKDNFARAQGVFGPLDQLIPDGGFQILVEPKFSTEIGSQELGTNAAYISGGQAFLLVQMSSLERIPLGMNPSVLAHEFGHHVFHITYEKADGTCRVGDNASGPVPPGRFSAADAIRGFNEGFADITAFALQQETRVLSDSIPELDNGERTLDMREPGFLAFTWSTRDRCGDSFYCIGTLWARAVFEMYLATGGRPDDVAARSAFARTIATAVAGIPGRLRQRTGWTVPTKACEFADLDEEVTLVRAYVEDFIAGLPASLQPSACRELASRFEITPAGCP